MYSMLVSHQIISHEAECAASGHPLCCAVNQRAPGKDGELHRVTASQSRNHVIICSSSIFSDLACHHSRPPAHSVAFLAAAAQLCAVNSSHEASSTWVSASRHGSKGPSRLAWLLRSGKQRIHAVIKHHMVLPPLGRRWPRHPSAVWSRLSSQTRNIG
jgi:hypothetical protein